MRNPHNRWLYPTAVAALLLATGAGVVVYVFLYGRHRASSLDARAKANLASVTIAPVRTAAMQREWVLDGFGPVELIAPAGPRPCVQNEDLYFGRDRTNQTARIESLLAIVAQDRTNRFPALILATELTNAGRHEEAERVAMEALAVGPDVSANLTLFQLLNVMHLHHVRGVARLSGPPRVPPWTSLKHTIRAATLLRVRGQLGRREGDDVWRAVIIPTPNCSPLIRRDGLSVDDLENNLLVAYMRGSFRNENERASEFGRAVAAAPTTLQRLFYGHVETQKSRKFPHESQLWALSNVERILADVPPNDARLCITAIEVIDWWTAPERCPSSLCTTELLANLNTLRGALLERAVRARNVTTHQRAAFARSVARHLASTSLPSAKVYDAVLDVRSWLNPAERRTLDRMHSVAHARTELPRWITERDDFRLTFLEEFEDRWKEAAMYDFAASASERVRQWPAEDRPRTIRVLRRLVAGGDVPPQLEALTRELSWFDQLSIRLTTSRWSWVAQAVLVTLVLWIAMLWFLVQLWEQRMLRTSLYNVELDQLIISEAGQRMTGS